VSDCCLSESAKEDLLDIFLYTLEFWGEDQAPAYQKLLKTAMQRIAENPFTPGSKAHHEIMQGCRTFRCGKHFLIYRVQSSQVQIARILHESMDFSRHVGEETFP
jgi:toxin ParE1/3/4